MGSFDHMLCVSSGPCHAHLPATERCSEAPLPHAGQAPLACVPLIRQALCGGAPSVKWPCQVVPLHVVAEHAAHDCGLCHPTAPAAMRQTPKEEEFVSTHHVHH
jgi:hypothetical protein